jgi:hypothetical protein
MWIRKIPVHGRRISKAESPCASKDQVAHAFSRVLDQARENGAPGSAGIHSHDVTPGGDSIYLLEDFNHRSWRSLRLKHLTRPPFAIRIILDLNQNSWFDGTPRQFTGKLTAAAAGQPRSLPFRPDRLPEPPTSPLRPIQPPEQAACRTGPPAPPLSTRSMHRL